MMLSKETGYMVVWVLDRDRQSIDSDVPASPQSDRMQRQGRQHILYWYIDHILIGEETLSKRHPNDKWWRRFCFAPDAAEKDHVQPGSLFEEWIEDLKR